MPDSVDSFITDYAIIINFETLNLFSIKIQYTANIYPTGFATTSCKFYVYIIINISVRCPISVLVGYLVLFQYFATRILGLA